MTKRYNVHLDDSSNRSKRTRINNEGEDAIKDTTSGATHTQGPLDSTFGQHAAFPMGVSDEYTGEIGDSVQSYMESVREEAEKDRSIYFVERPQTQPAEEHDDKESNHTKNDDEPEASSDQCKEINSAWKKELMDEFLSLKNEVEIYLQSLKLLKTQESHSTPIEQTTSLQYTIPETANGWREYIINNPPPPIRYFFESLNRPTVIKLFIYAAKWLNANSNENLSKWIFLLFLRLDNLLDHIDSSIVRDLAKKALKIKNNTQPQCINDISKYTIDMIILIVGEYYRQRDLLLV